jgi:polyhydroxyalkanoate synthesis regulator phasin
MNANPLIQTLQKGYLVSIGATASLLESLQDAQQRDANFAKLRNDPNQLIEDLALKGETTEREARTFVDRFFNPSASTPPSGDPRPNSPPAAASSVQQDLEELTAQLAALRTELERLRADRP